MSPASKPSDSEGGTAFIADLRPALVAYFQRRCGNAAEAEDLAQDVILRALNHAEWTSVEEARGYIFRIALNRWRDRGRRKVTHGTEIDWDDESTLGVAEEISPERVLSSQEQLRRIASALQALEERTRNVFVLCRLEQMKQKEIADLLGISVSAVEKHLVKALAHVARWMEKDGFN
jgi:RNA polymerase sigma factor (sigma-70 family)